MESNPSNAVESDFQIMRSVFPASMAVRPSGVADVEDVEYDLHSEELRSVKEANKFEIGSLKDIRMKSIRKVENKKRTSIEKSISINSQNIQFISKLQ